MNFTKIALIINIVAIYEEDVEFETQMHDNWIKIFKEKGII